MAVIQDLLDTRKRFDRWHKTQSQIGKNDMGAIQVEAQMLNSRTKFMAPGERVFFERVLGQSDLMPIRYLEQGLQVARSVGRIRVATPDIGEGYATGFLVAPGLLLTNHHVLPLFERAVAATVSFEAEDGLDGMPKTIRTFRLDPESAFVADEKLDFCFVGVHDIAIDRTRLDSFGFLKLYEERGKILRDEYASIIQHPHGRQKHIAIRENKVVVYVYDDQIDEGREDNNFLYYSTDTTPGSSGSPVFSDQWTVVALHRRGVPKTKVVRGRRRVLRTNGQPAHDDDPDSVIDYEANEGVRVSRILGCLRALSEHQTAQGQAARDVLARVQSAARTCETTGLSISSFVPGSQPQLSASRLAVEISRTTLARFPEGDGYGYDPEFLGIAVPLPRPSATLERSLARRIDRPDEWLLPFRHFTTCVHARRRLPVFAAVNLADLGRPERMPARPGWYIDPRIEESEQPDDSLFSQMVQRGHMAAREYVYWGTSSAEKREADIHSFTLTNVCPQLDSFNGSSGEWFKVERLIVSALKSEHGRCSVFMGPVFRSSDRKYDTLRGEGSDANWESGIRIPTQFWKVVVWVESDKLFYRAFLFDQRDEIRNAGPLEFDFETPVGVKETDLKSIEKAVGLTFDF